ncbi:glycosyltransferase [Actinomadura parmotrematis]|uniref:Glycosyltransferase n=1 Tax=Actinomadura parmotrematis TaxID=2864039 RepID=A0ABS7G2Q0_9ACTN|nr:glycosyltransferase [Actinomadura parmotrematis]MBW8486994.1 glycosyltransferase [Actinomadura parmotrematis]
MRPLRIALIASARFPIREPFAGGLEAHTWALARALQAGGHRVTLFAGAGSDPGLGVRELAVHVPEISEAARRDVSMPGAAMLADHHAYLQLMLELAASREFDLVHNNSLHYLPIAMAAALPVPVLTTLHTPPTPWLESAIQAPRRCPVTFAAVSAHAARAWRHLVPDARVVANGVDVRRWTPGPGGGAPVWFGRLVPEKGAHLAIEAARLAGLPLRIAGPVSAPEYFEARIRPLLGEGVEYLGHLGTAELAGLLGGAAAVLVTPCWDEPYGLVVAEALACGTPVCGFARGALPELVTDACGRLVPGDDVAALAAALAETVGLSRADARAHAERTCSLEAMVGRYEQLYWELAA